jgi:hypothetical protein
MALQRTVKKPTRIGFVIGMLMTLATVVPSTIIVPILAIITLYRGTRVKSRVLIFWLIMAVIIGSKAIMTGGLAINIIKDYFLITTLAFFSLLRVEKHIIYGVAVAYFPIALLDATSNLIQLYTGEGLFTNTTIVLREDGSRLTGIFGNSFFSLCIYLTIIFAMMASGLNKLYHLAFMIMMILVGSLRAYILPILMILYRFLFKFEWFIVFLFSISISILIGLLNYYSVKYGFYSDNSGNAYRVFAWTNAISLISDAPILGSNITAPLISAEIGINEDSIIEYHIYESPLLQDAVRYGLAFVALKLTFFYLIGKQFFARGATYADRPLAFTKNAVVALIVTDYIIFSFFGMVTLALAAGLVLATKEAGSD